jgi:hypothetical protein
MRAVITILIIFCFDFSLLCPQRDKAPQPLTEAELQQIRDRLPCLKAGMTVKEAFDLLGVDITRRAVDLSGSGPTDDYRYVYQLAETSNKHGYNLVIVTDQDRKFKRAEIACWADHAKCLEDNQKAKERPKECPTPAPGQF